MRMNLKAAAAATLAISACGTALALPVASAIDQRVYVSGASAQDGGIEFAVRRVCVGGASAAASTLDLYRISGNDRVWTCETNNSLIPGIGTGGGTGGNVRIAIYKFSSGGSGNGVNPLIDNSTLAFRGVQASTSCSTVTPVAASGSFVALEENSGCTNATTENVVPQIGFSDVEPNKFTTAGRAANLTAAGANQLVMGIVVSTNLYRALQASQSLGNDDEYVNMPTLSSTTVANAFNGNLVDWSQVTDRAGNSLPAPSSGDGTVNICRRADSSGTQAITEITFLRQRCTSLATTTSGFLPADGAGGAGPNNTSTGTTAAPNFGAGRVYAGSGSTQVRDCLDAANTQGRFAIGLLSTECAPGNVTSCGSTVARNYRFVKVDSAAPTLVDTVAGKYNFYAEQSINSRPTLSGAGLSVRNRLLALLSDVNVIEQINVGFRQTFGDSGLLGVPNANAGLTAVPPYTEAAVRANAINSTFKNPQGTGTNNCQVAPAVNASFVVADPAPILPQGL